MSRTYINLQPSEIALLQAASQIFAAYITSGQCASDKENEFLKKSIQQAIRMAQLIDDVVQADKEV